jgi:hypothetical protein
MRRQAELALAANKLAQLENYAALCQALGGGTEVIPDQLADHVPAASGLP